MINIYCIFLRYGAVKDYTQLLDEVFVIFKIIMVELGVISRSGRLRLITLPKTLIILDIRKTDSNKK